MSGEDDWDKKVDFVENSLNFFFIYKQNFVDFSSFKFCRVIQFCRVIHLKFVENYSAFFIKNIISLKNR